MNMVTIMYENMVTIMYENMVTIMYENNAEVLLDVYVYILTCAKDHICL